MGVCYIILGTNLGDRLLNLSKAKTLLKQSIGNIICQSFVYESEPWGYVDSLSYNNQVLQIQTKLSAVEVLQLCLSIETKMGRIRTKEGYESRIIDIDLLFYGQEIVQTKDLILPHPEIQNRRFVLVPMCEIESGFVHPVLKQSMETLLKECTDSCWVKRML